MNKSAIAVCAFLGVIWGSNFIFVKMAAAFISPLQITLLRALFGLTPVLTYAVITGAMRREYWKRPAFSGHVIAGHRALLLRFRQGRRRAR
ncbi:hypothetical protein BVH03_11410 [Pseudomonas sp. PA15(2017)]|uniref:EamA family transporter n=1 Tax=Pseudomonas sp. PA15(2017) TaxID=1932111 RepID=UPI00095B16E5|nr:EamA family transporter [Pseudomonas sp. PA15(2017)]OLU29089.1 hypothetical protein BVH03_11410 [Pseudomonas sp. PA15(2017)]